jgi:hypothetical protein
LPPVIFTEVLSNQLKGRFALLLDLPGQVLRSVSALGRFHRRHGKASGSLRSLGSRCLGGLELFLRPAAVLTRRDAGFYVPPSDGGHDEGERNPSVAEFHRANPVGIALARRRDLRM